MGHSYDCDVCGDDRGHAPGCPAAHQSYYRMSPTQQAVERNTFKSAQADWEKLAVAKSERPLLKDKVWLSVASDIARLGTCARRKVGCVLLDARGHVLSSGYNGTAAGVTNCIDIPCAGANMPSGTGLDACEAIHAEQNALLQCRDVQAIHTAYCTASPCVHCVKLLMNTGATRIVFLEEYPHGASKELWLKSKSGRQWVKGNL